MYKAFTTLRNPGNPLQICSSAVQRRSTRQLCVRVRAWRMDPESQNPLELLRVCKNPRERAALLRALDDSWAQAVESYRPSSVEVALQQELGIWEQTVMQLALSQPDLVQLQADEQVKPALKAMKAAGMGSQDIWFLVQKRGVYLLSIPTTLQRWLDFISVYGLNPRGIQNFLLRAPETLFQDTTLYQAGQVVSYLRTLGLNDEYLAQRVFPIWPEVLTRDVEEDLRPVVTFLLSLGIEMSEVTRIMLAWPELLLARVDTQLSPWAQYLAGELGASGTQVAEVIRLCPHLIGLKADDVFGRRVRSLSSVGITKQDLASMVAKSLRWLTTGGGVQQPLDFLLNKAGFSKEEVRALLLESPDVLAEKEHELERKWAFITQVLGATKDEVVSCPQVMAHHLTQVLGPRHGFLEKQGKLGLVTKGDMKEQMGPVGHRAGMYDLAKLSLPLDDAEWCLANSVSLMDLSRYRAHWEHEGGEILTPVVKLSPAEELAAELRKLGISQL